MTSENIAEAKRSSSLRLILICLYDAESRNLPDDPLLLNMLSQFCSAFLPNYYNSLFRQDAYSNGSERSLSLAKYETCDQFRFKRVHVIVRRHWWPGQPNTREHELWYWFYQIFIELRLPVTRIDAAGASEVRAYLDTVSPDDLILIDLQCGTWSEPDHVEIAEKLASARAKSIGFLTDAWAEVGQEKLGLYQGVLNVIWGGPEVLKVYNARGPTDSMADVTDFPIPCLAATRQVVEQVRARTRRACFKGSIEQNNFPRLIWYSALALNKNVDFQISSIHADGLSSEESYYEYVKEICRSDIICNFGMRSSGETIITGRFYEALAAGRLLLQERCAESTRYFIEGDHFLQFGSYDELMHLCEQYVDSNARHTIGAEARAFAFANYSPQHWISHMSTFF